MDSLLDLYNLLVDIFPGHRIFAIDTVFVLGCVTFYIKNRTIKHPRYLIRFVVFAFLFMLCIDFLLAGKEFQGLSYDMLISHTTIVFTRYIVLSWQHRCSTDQRTLGGIFYDACDEVGELDWAVALKQLWELIDDCQGEQNPYCKYD